MKVFALVAASLAVGGHATKDKTITRVVKVLQDMMAKSKKEGDEEREIFAKFKCFCDDNEREKKDSISDLGKDISVLSSKIEELQGSTGGLSTDCAKLKADIAANEAAQAEATTIRGNENAEYIKEKADMEQAIDQMNDAIETLSEIGADQTLGAAADHDQFMAGKFLQSKVNSNSRVRKALEAVSGFLNPEQSKSVQSFLQNGAPFTGTYTSQSGQIVGTLKSMRDTFETNLKTAIEVEKQQLKAFNKLMQTLAAAKQKMEDSYDSKQEGLGSNDGDLEAKKQQLSEAKEQKENDEEYLEKLLDMCEMKTKQYNERKMLRANEDAAIAEAIAILNSDEAFAAFDKTDATSYDYYDYSYTYYGHPPSKFIQLSSRHVRVHTQSTTLPEQVKSALMQAKSPRVAKIAGLIQAENVFATVLDEIDKMLDVIEKEGTADQENLDWCNDERTENDADLSDANNEIDTLNIEIDTLDASINDPATGLKVQIKDTETALAQNLETQKTETKERQEANSAYQQDVRNLVAAQKILKKAIKVLKKYYEKLEKRIAETGFLQEDPVAPSTWSDSGETGGYSGQSGQGNDVISQLEYILDESEREEEEAHHDEEDSQHAYEDSMQGLKDQEAADEKALAGLQTTLANEEENLVLKQKELKATKKEKKAIQAYLLKIKPGCDFITTNFADRERNRGLETTALNRAKTLIKGTPAYQNYEAEERIEGFGDCKEPCEEDEHHVKCKACLAKVTPTGYCAGHGDTDGCYYYHYDYY